jgi:hypothetical protein
VPGYVRLEYTVGVVAQYKKLALRIFSVGTLLAAALAAVALVFMNPPQCKQPYSQQEIIESGCVVGSNIGLTIMLLWAVLIWLGSAVLALIVYVSNRRKHRLTNRELFSK